MRSFVVAVISRRRPGDGSYLEQYLTYSVVLASVRVALNVCSTAVRTILIKWPESEASCRLRGQMNSYFRDMVLRASRKELISFEET